MAEAVGVAKVSRGARLEVEVMTTRSNVSNIVDTLGCRHSSSPHRWCHVSTATKPRKRPCRLDRRMRATVSKSPAGSSESLLPARSRWRSSRTAQMGNVDCRTRVCMPTLTLTTESPQSLAPSRKLEVLGVWSSVRGEPACAVPPADSGDATWENTNREQHHAPPPHHQTCPPHQRPEPRWRDECDPVWPEPGKWHGHGGAMKGNIQVKLK